VQPARVGAVARKEGADDIEQVIGAAHREAADEGRLVGARLRQDEGARRRCRCPLQRERHRQRAVHRSQLAAERDLAGELEGVEPGRVDLAGGGEDAEGDRQVEATRFLGQVGRCEADRHALVVREFEAARLQGGADPLARLLDLGVGQADEREARQAVGEVHFDRHRR